MRQWLVVLSVLVIIVGTGCVAAIGNRAPCSSRQAVVRDGEIYIVNVNSGYVKQVPRSAIEDADVIRVETKDIEVED